MMLVAGEYTSSSNHGCFVDNLLFFGLAIRTAELKHAKANSFGPLMPAVHS